MTMLALLCSAEVPVGRAKLTAHIPFALVLSQDIHTPISA